ncbi:putative MOB kinase activator family [Helianthus debilis subsp. tardiflorus]
MGRTYTWACSCVRVEAITAQMGLCDLGLCVLCDSGYTSVPFPSNFQDVVKTIFKRLFRVYAHIYHSHFQMIMSLKEEAHLNTYFKHFVLFTCVNHVH